MIILALLALLGYKGGWFDQRPKEIATLEETAEEFFPDQDSAWEDGLLSEEDIALLDGLWETGDQHLVDNPPGLTMGLLADDSVLQDFPGRLPVAKLESIVGDRIVSVNYIRFGEHVEYYAVIDRFGNGADIYYNRALNKITFFNIGFNDSVLLGLPQRYDEAAAKGAALGYLSANSINISGFSLIKKEHIDSHKLYWFEWASDETLIQVVVSSTIGRVVVYTANLAS